MPLLCFRYRFTIKDKSTYNQTLQQTADNLGVELKTLMAFLQSASIVITDADRIKTCQLIVFLQQIIKKVFFSNPTNAAPVDASKV